MPTVSRKAKRTQSPPRPAPSPGLAGRRSRLTTSRQSAHGSSRPSPPPPATTNNVHHGGTEVTDELKSGPRFFLLRALRVSVVRFRVRTSQLLLFRGEESFVPRTLIRQKLRTTVEERFENVMALQRFALASPLSVCMAKGL
jgi:hypothetical protein